MVGAEERKRVSLKEFVTGIGQKEMEEGAVIESAEVGKKVGRAIIERVEVNEAELPAVTELMVNPNDLLRYIGAQALHRLLLHSKLII